jgi:hypothetical protein
MKSAGARGADHARIREKSGNGGNTPDIRADMPGNTSVVPSLSEAEKRRSVSPAARWPASWRALLEKTPPAPLVWTYEELGSDLLGDASPERSHCLKTLIGALSLPRGTSAFWPLDLPGGSAPGDDIAGSRGEDVAAGALFASGVALLRASMVMYFGAGAASRSGFAVQLRYPFTQRISGGVLHILLPPLSALAESPDRIDKAVAYLRSVLSDHPLLQGKR